MYVMKNAIFVDDINIFAFKNMLKNIDDSESNIIIVPDKFSLNAEQLFFEEKNISVNFNTRIFSLTKFASNILEEILLDKKIIDKSQSLLILSSIIKDNIDNFKYFKNIKDINSFTEDIFNSLSQLLSSDFEKEKEELPINLKNKFDDIKLILNLYKQNYSKNLVDSSFKFDLFLSEIKNSDLIRKTNFYFGMFNNLTPQVKKIIKEIYKFSKSCFFSCGYSKNRVNNNEIFEFFKKIDKNLEIKFNNSLYGYSKFINDEFFTRNDNKFTLKNDEIKIFEAETIDDEISNLCYQIKKDILVDNLRFKDICVCSSSLDVYKEKIKTNFDEFKLNYFCDETEVLSNFSYPRFLVKLFSFLNKFNLNNVINLVDDFYVDISIEKKNNFKNFLFKYNIIDVNKLDEYKMFSDDENYEDFLFVKNFVIDKIVEIRSKNIESVYDFFNILDDLIKQFNSEAKLEDKIEYYRDVDIKKFKQYSQIKEKLDDIKQKLTEFYTENFDLSRFIYFFNICLENTTISLASTTVDCIFVGDNINSYFKTYKKIYVLGMDSKKFPLVQNSNGLLKDEELKELETTEISPKIEDINRLNYYKSLLILLSSEKNLVLSYSSSSEDGSKNFPSIFIKNFCKRFKNNEKDLKPLKINNETLNLLKKDEILNIIPFKFSSIQNIERECLVSTGKTKEVLEDILKHKNLVFNYDKTENVVDLEYFQDRVYSSSSLEDYFACSYRYFYKNILKLKKQEQLNLDSRVIGNIVHNCCFLLGKYLIENRQITKELKEQIYASVLKKSEYEFLQIYKDKKYILYNLKNEIFKLFDFIINQQNESEFKISKVEHLFKTNINGINFKGFIDRIDETDDEFIIIDYKTGKTTINYEEIILNKKIQLILYAKILEKLINKKCAGVFYLTINDDYSSKENKNINFNGIVVNCDNNLEKLGINSGLFNIDDKYILSFKEFENLKEYVFNNIIEAVRKIKKGEIKENPTNIDGKSCCEYCEFLEICKNKQETILKFDKEKLKEILDD